MGGRIEAIYLKSGRRAAMARAESAVAVAGSGLVGDLHGPAPDRPTPGTPADEQVTLIEAEAIEGVEVELSQAESRRNIVTRGIDLNGLVGRVFLAGEVRLRGIRPCDPCRHLERLTRPGVMAALRGRGGLRAEVLDGGPIRVGDRVEEVHSGGSAVRG